MKETFYSFRITKLFMLVTFLTLVSFLSKELKAESLWNGRKNPYGQKRALSVGDVVTVIVSEQASATQQSSTQTAGKTTNNVNAGTGFMGFIPLGTSDTQVDYTGNGATTSSNNLAAKISVKIARILPNGNFHVEGRRQIQINDEMQEMVISGEIRPDDIQADNTVESAYLADAKIEYKGKGAISRTQKPGILNKVLHWLL